MLVFKGTKQGKAVLYGQIYTSYPFAASFLIVFTVDEQPKDTGAPRSPPSCPPTCAPGAT